MYENSKGKWGRIDAHSARYFYRVQYNIPRVPVERTDELTEYEFDYELLLRNEYYEYLKDLRAEDKVSLDGDGFEKEIRTDPELYESIVKRAEAGEFIDFKLPDDSNLPKLSQRMGGHQDDSVQSQQPDDFVPVKPEEIFGRVFGGGKRA